jgi:rhodanese-related sulfurtransferase
MRRRAYSCPDGLVVLYCACPRKTVDGVYLLLRDQSYRAIAVMEDGFAAWISQGYPIER